MLPSHPGFDRQEATTLVATIGGCVQEITGRADLPPPVMLFLGYHGTATGDESTGGPERAFGLRDERWVGFPARLADHLAAPCRMVGMIVPAEYPVTLMTSLPDYQVKCVLPVHIIL